MAARIKMIRMCKSFAFASLFSTMTGEDMLVVIVIEVLVFVNVIVRHSSCFLKKYSKNNSVECKRKISSYHTFTLNYLDTVDCNSYIGYQRTSTQAQHPVMALVF